MSHSEQEKEREIQYETAPRNRDLPDPGHGTVDHDRRSCRRFAGAQILCHKLPADTSRTRVAFRKAVVDSCAFDCWSARSRFGGEYEKGCPVSSFGLGCRSVVLRFGYGWSSG